jgi:hypothetical protein
MVICTDILNNIKHLQERILTMTPFNKLELKPIPLTLNGKELLVNLIVCLYHDDTDLDFDFGDEIENQAYLNRFHTGELMNIGIVVKASIQLGTCNLTGEDSLWAVHVRTRHMDTDVNEIIESQAMVDTAIDEILSQYKDLAEFFK